MIKYCIFCVIGLLLTAISVQGQKEQVATKNWLPVYDFNAAQFKKPSQEFGPFARWWWPGNDVTKNELQIEINLFADNAFGGVEVQTLTLGLPKSSKETSEKILSWDTPEYYEHLKTVMEEARKRDLIVDMTNGSGWPTGGPYFSPEDGFINLAFAAKDIIGGTFITMAIPVVENTTGVPSKLQAVLAIKFLAAKTNTDPKTISLESSSTFVITGNVKNDTLKWSAPAGNWKIIS